MNGKIKMICLIFIILSLFFIVMSTVSADDGNYTLHVCEKLGDGSTPCEVTTSDGKVIKGYVNRHAGITIKEKNQVNFGDDPLFSYQKDISIKHTKTVKKPIKKWKKYTYKKKVPKHKYKKAWVVKKVKTYESWKDYDGYTYKVKTWNAYSKLGYKAKYIKNVWKYYSDGDICYSYFKVPGKVKKIVGYKKVKRTGKKKITVGYKKVKKHWYTYKTVDKWGTYDKFMVNYKNHVCEKGCGHRGYEE